MPVALRLPSKKAVLVGITYALNENLKKNGLRPQPGAPQDVERLRDLLIEHYDYKSEDITLLVDEPAPNEVRNAKSSPTRDNILKAAADLVAQAREGDHIVFAFSGHGGQVAATQDQEEIDGMDEVLLPVDALFDSAAPAENDGLVNFIRDDEIRVQFVKKLQPGVRCTLIFDCCHSGTASDLPCVEDCLITPISPIVNSRVQSSGSFVRMKTVNHEAPWTWPSTRASTPVRRSSIDENKAVTAWSACLDEQITFGGKTGGIFMKAFVNALKKQPRPTHHALLRSLTKEIQHVVEHKNQSSLQKGSGNELPIPRPQLGSLQPDAILKDEFIL